MGLEEEVRAKRRRGEDAEDGAKDEGMQGVTASSGLTDDDRQRQKRDREEGNDDEAKMEIDVAAMKIEVNQESDEDAEEYAEGWATDDISGKTICRKLVDEARGEVVEFMKKIGLWDEVDVEECWQKTGKAPVTTKWIDINKGTEEDPLIRSRLVARHFKTEGDKVR